MSARSHSFHAFGPAGSVLATPRRRSPRRNPHRLAYPHRADGEVLGAATGGQPYGTTQALRDGWWFEYELHADGCVGTLDRERATVVAGAHPTMRMVRFGLEVSFTSAGDGGSDADYDGTDLRPIIATWPADEQVRYRRGPNFMARSSTTPDGKTITRELTWFSTLDAAGQLWTSRLRDRSGQTLLVIDSDLLPTILREGDALYWIGGRLEN